MIHCITSGDDTEQLRISIYHKMFKYILYDLLCVTLNTGYSETIFMIFRSKNSKCIADGRLKTV